MIANSQHAFRRGHPSVVAALLLTVTVWNLLVLLPGLSAASLGPDGARLLAFVAALTLVLACRSRGRAATFRRSAARCCSGLFAGLFAGSACLALCGGRIAWAAAGIPPAPRAAVLFGVVVVLAAPALEELLYREQLFDAFRGALGTAVTVPLTSLLFALPHLHPPLVLATFTVGLGLAALRAWGASVALCIGVHSGLNAASVFWSWASSRSALPLAVVAAVAISAVVAPAVAKADPLRWRGTLEIALIATGTPPLAVTGSGVATVNGSGGPFPLVSLHLAGGITGSVTVPVTDPEVTASIPSVRATVTLGTGRLSPFWPELGPGARQLAERELAVNGQLRVCSYVPRCGSGLRIPLNVEDGVRAVGVGGTWTVGGYGARRVSIEAAPWTVGTATALVATGSGSQVAIPSFGWAHGPFSFATSAALTGGEVALVTPIRIVSSGGRRLSAFGRLKLRFAPEPRSLPLLVAGVAFLAAAGRRSIRPTSHPGPS